MADQVAQDFTRDYLDREYNNQAKIPDYQAYVEYCRRESEAARAGLPCYLDVPYDPASGQSLDIFPVPGAVRRPVEVYFHGGYWRRLDKSDFSYVAHGFGGSGIVSVIVNYSLIPSVSMAELIRQCAQAVAWVSQNIAKYGGDPNSIFLSGHSAGGHIVAAILSSNWGDVGPAMDPSGIKGATVISGIYDLAPVRNCFLQDTLQLTEAEVEQFSPVLHRPQVACPVLIAVGGAEGPEYARQSKELAAAWHGFAAAPEVVSIHGENHFSIRDQLGDANSDMIALMRTRIWRKTNPY